MQKASLPAAPHYWKIYSSCTLSHVCSQWVSFAGFYPSLVIKMYINMGLTYCMRKCLLWSVFLASNIWHKNWEFPEEGGGGGRGAGVVEVCECACSRDRMTTFDLCSPWCKASRITSCKVTVWTAAHACLCLSTQGGTQFLKEALQYLSLQLDLQSIVLCIYIYTCIYKYTILKTMTKVTFVDIFCIWHNKDRKSVSLVLKF